MKGLLIKDILIIKNMNRTGVILLALYAMYMFMGMETFAMSFTAIMMVILTGSTISYDEFDNGYTFLFTMPFSRAQYVTEKYVLLLGSTVIGTTLVYLLVLLLKLVGISHALMEDLLPTYVLTIFMGAFISAVMIPIQLKYGSEKGRVRLFTAMALIVVIMVTVARVTPQPMLAGIATFLDSLPIVTVVAGFMLVMVAILVVSYNVSRRIMAKKEF